jgi:hypothetical protein
MFPYLTAPPFRLGSVVVSRALVLAAIAVLVGHFLLIRRVRTIGLDHETAALMSLVMALFGLVISCWFRGLAAPTGTFAGIAGRERGAK